MLNVYMTYYNSTCIHNATIPLTECKKEHKKYKTFTLEAKLIKKEKNIEVLVKKQTRIYINNDDDDYDDGDDELFLWYGWPTKGA